MVQRDLQRVLFQENPRFSPPLRNGMKRPIEIFLLHILCSSLATELQPIHFNDGNYIIGVGIYSIEAGGYNVFDSHARDMYHPL